MKVVLMIVIEIVILMLVKANSPIDLNSLKEQTALSGKKWDLAIKGLSKHQLVKVTKTETGLFAELL